MIALTIGRTAKGPMTAETIPDKVATITAREKSRIISTSEDW
jgi:hypothetical protein